ncbi:MAG: hypothetical protein ACRD29_13865 [Acidimicrobiales bacterium]
MAASSPPGLAEIYEADTDRAAFLAIAEHAALYRWTNVAMVLGTAIGVAAGWRLRACLRDGERSPRLTTAAFGMSLVAAVAWAVEVALRATATVSRARDVAAGTAEPGSFPGGNLAVFLVFLVGTCAATVALAWQAWRSRFLWGPVVGLVALAAVVATAVAVPITIYVFGVMPMGVAVLVRRWRTSRAASRWPARGRRHLKEQDPWMQPQPCGAPFASVCVRSPPARTTLLMAPGADTMTAAVQPFLDAYADSDKERALAGFVA